MRKLLRNNGLSIVLLLLFLIFWSCQAVAGFRADNQEKMERGRQPQSFLDYLASGDFWEATAENWESEFLQMGLYVILTVWLYQKGSAESNDPGKKEDVQEDAKSHRTPDAPKVVQRGGWLLKIYNHSLSIALLSLFLLSISIHAVAGWKQYNDQQRLDNLPEITFSQFITSATFWFQSFQNWQSEFLAIFCMVVFTIFLRQKGSAQSKPVFSPHSKTGKG